MKSNITLEQSLLAYRVMHTPTEYSWKQHWVKETFSDDDFFKCTREEQLQFNKRLLEGKVTICNHIAANQGRVSTLADLLNIIVDANNKGIVKDQRKVVYSSGNGERPVGKKAFEIWDGFQVIDMDIKDKEMTEKLKVKLFERLKKCNWFLGVTLSSSGKGLHVYTKIAVAESDKENGKKKLLYLTNFRHKYSFVYLACLKIGEELGFDKEKLLKWLDLAMFRPQQGAFIGYDEHPLINTHFFEDFIYVNFDNVEDIGSPNIDWVTYPDLKEVFKRWEWFEDGDEEETNVVVRESPELEVDMHNKVHYKHFERWRLANTLVSIYGENQGYKYLRMICSNKILDKELQADCITASRHKKPIDVWAVNRLNTQHGFRIKLNVAHEEVDLQKLYNSIDNIDNPTLIQESPNVKQYHIKSNEFLGTIKHQLLNDCGRVTLIEAGAGVGKTEMVKSLAREGKRIMMVMPFTSTIKAKVEGDTNWYYSYGNRKVRYDKAPCIALTIDKFSRENLMEVKDAGIDYIFIDESHLMFQSEYRPVMPKVIEMICNSEVPIILMSGTPVGETVFFPDIIHLKVIKDDNRQKEFNVMIVDTPSDMIYHMCRNMANDIANGKRILFPTNKGTLYKEQINAAVQWFLEHDHMWFEPITVNYYKKSNIGERFMDDVNVKKSISDTNILMCSNYLSVGVDIMDKLKFSIYFADTFMPQEIEQFANRLRANDLFIYMYISQNDADGNSKNINQYNELNMKLNEDEIKDAHSILRLCNAMIERNPVEYKYNSLVSSIIHNDKYVEYNEIENKYYLNDIAYKVTFFERKYRDYVQQLPVLVKGMMAYGYTYSSKYLQEFEMEDSKSFANLDDLVKAAYDNRVKSNTEHIEELLDIITEDRLSIYRGVLSGEYDIKKGEKWSENLQDRTMVVKNIEIFEKVIPLFVSMSKMFAVDDIKSIFEYCRNKNGSYNFAAIRRIRMLTNIIWSNKNNQLDIPITEFMNRTYQYVDENPNRHKLDVQKFINEFAQEYALKESSNDVIIGLSPITIKTMSDALTDVFKCLVTVSRPNCCGFVYLTKAELLWDEKEDNYNAVANLNDKLFILADFLECIDVDHKDINLAEERKKVNEIEDVTIEEVKVEEEEEEEENLIEDDEEMIIDEEKIIF